jgi:hypothetical protein
LAGRGAGGPGPIGRAGERARSWARRSVARERVFGGLRTLLWVAPLTVLIWVYAEREQAVSVPNVRVGIEVTSNDPSTIVTLAPGVQPWLTATLFGPRAQLDVARERVEYGGNNPPVRMEVSPKLGTGRQRVPANRIANDPRFVTNGITVTNAAPDWIDVVIDPIVERDVKVSAEPEFLRNTLSPPTFDPPTVKVRGPEQVLADAERQGKLVVYASLDRPDIVGVLGQTDQASVTVKDVKVYLPLKEKNVTVAGNPSVTATVVPARPAEKTFDFVSVEEIWPTGMADEFKVTHDRTVKNVTVVGPRDKIDRLKDPPTARFRIPPDAKEGPNTARLWYDFGDLNGLVSVKPGAAQDQFDYTLTRR